MKQCNIFSGKAEILILISPEGRIVYNVFLK